ncbi:uncharacterized protein LOC116083335 isoform X2 [Mastomys coucha]|uniref:uncharacterized protein LOC116083335 isoform X2 n=1 Tax=Mastomys coucha TaxID=35658 RepID=UPI00126258F1|nr:uncharacterized protein LOC116083335 isoform X2 [Mastomys coucha]
MCTLPHLEEPGNDWIHCAREGLQTKRCTPQNPSKTRAEVTPTIWTMTAQIASKNWEEHLVTSEKSETDQGDLGGPSASYFRSEIPVQGPALSVGVCPERHSWSGYVYVSHVCSVRGGQERDTDSLDLKSQMIMSDYIEYHVSQAGVSFTHYIVKGDLEVLIDPSRLHFPSPGITGCIIEASFTGFDYFADQCLS